jgi:hypothetical protein
MTMIRSVIRLSTSLTFVLASASALAQRPTVALRGQVLDGAGHPIESAEVTASSVGRLTRTDGDGRFAIDTVVAGSNRVLVRLLGWQAIDTTFVVDAKKPTVVRIVMARVAQNLNEVRIVSQDQCANRTLEGFNCRRVAGIGAFRDSAEIAALKPVCYANIAQGMDGLRLVPGVPCPKLESTKGWRCIRMLVDGRPPIQVTRLKMSQFIGVEFYDVGDKVPEWYKIYAYESAVASVPTHQDTSGYPMIYRTPALPGRACALIVYWTHLADR